MLLVSYMGVVGEGYASPSSSANRALDAITGEPDSLVLSHGEVTSEDVAKPTNGRGTQ
jgi:hypothetical protein